MHARDSRCKQKWVFLLNYEDVSPAYNCWSENPADGVKYWIGAKWSVKCNNYVWCPDKEILSSDIKWKKGYPKTGGGLCVGIHLGNSKPEENGLFNGKCSDVTRYFCIVSEHWKYQRKTHIAYGINIWNTLTWQFCIYRKQMLDHRQHKISRRCWIFLLT